MVSATHGIKAKKRGRPTLAMIREREILMREANAQTDRQIQIDKNKQNLTKIARRNQGSPLKMVKNGKKRGRKPKKLLMAKKPVKKRVVRSKTEEWDSDFSPAEDESDVEYIPEPSQRENHSFADIFSKRQMEEYKRLCKSGSSAPEVKVEDNEFHEDQAQSSSQQLRNSATPGSESSFEEGERNQSNAEKKQVPNPDRESPEMEQMPVLLPEDFPILDAEESQSNGSETPSVIDEPADLEPENVEISFSSTSTISVKPVLVEEVAAQEAVPESQEKEKIAEVNAEVQTGDEQEPNVKMEAISPTSAPVATNENGANVMKAESTSPAPVVSEGGSEQENAIAPENVATPRDIAASLMQALLRGAFGPSAPVLEVRPSSSSNSVSDTVLIMRPPSDVQPQQWDDPYDIIQTLLFGNGYSMFTAANMRANKTVFCIINDAIDIPGVITPHYNSKDELDYHSFFCYPQKNGAFGYGYVMREISQNDFPPFSTVMPKHIVTSLMNKGEPFGSNIILQVEDGKFFEIAGPISVPPVDAQPLPGYFETMKLMINQIDRIASARPTKRSPIIVSLTKFMEFVATIVVCDPTSVPYPYNKDEFMETQRTLSELRQPTEGVERPHSPKLQQLDVNNTEAFGRAFENNFLGSTSSRVYEQTGAAGQRKEKIEKEMGLSSAFRQLKPHVALEVVRRGISNASPRVVTTTPLRSRYFDHCLATCNEIRA